MPLARSPVPEPGDNGCRAARPCITTGRIAGNDHYRVYRTRHRPTQRLAN